MAGKQSNRKSGIETVVNVGSGYFVAMGLNLFILPEFAEGIIQQSIFTAGVIGLIYTGVSMARSFAFRRIFEKYL